MIEKTFDIPFVADLALREKQIQQNYRPLIAVHKWFARRPGTLFRALLLAEFAKGQLQDAFYRSHHLNGLLVADPFMGGGTPVVEANRLGCDVIGNDINPMAYWIVREELEHLDLAAYQTEAGRLRKHLERRIGHLYRTRCLKCGSADAHVKYFLWVKVHPCARCDHLIDLFPGYLLAQDRRHPKNVLVCAHCGALNESSSRKTPGNCGSCGAVLLIEGPAKRNRCRCSQCDHLNTYPAPQLGPPRHRLFAIEYHCPQCNAGHHGRFFKAPDDLDLAKAQEAENASRQMRSRFVPDEEIPPGDESDRLHRWGYRRYREMFNARQLVGLELSSRYIARLDDKRVQAALATNLSDLLRYQNMLCRYDVMALKSLDIFSVHGFPVGLIQCESNLLGIPSSGRVPNIGSGGWSNIIAKYAKAKAYCEAPFEVAYQGGRKTTVATSGEWIGEVSQNGRAAKRRNIRLTCGDATLIDLPPASLDAVFTDPPYFGNVQYAELMDFCYTWLRRLAPEEPSFAKPSTRDPRELTGNENMKRGLPQFAEGLSATFCRFACALKPSAPFAFTYHHNRLEAYYPVAVAVLDAGLTCTASIPCPAEMGASIHINATGSSVVDTVFVCRSTGRIKRKLVPQSPEELALLVQEDLGALRQGHLKPSAGDIRCIVYGHLIRLVIWNARKNWDAQAPIQARLRAVEHWIQTFGGLGAVEHALNGKHATNRAVPTSVVGDAP